MREASNLALCFTTHMKVYTEPTPHSTIREALAENTGNLYTALKRNNYIVRIKRIAGRHFHFEWYYVDVTHLFGAWFDVCIPWYLSW